MDGVEPFEVHYHSQVELFATRRYSLYRSGELENSRGPGRARRSNKKVRKRERCMWKMRRINLRRGNT
jgi:hypothetical protein